jgi:hypothetical protein
VALKVFRSPAFPRPNRPFFELGNKLPHAVAIGLEDRVGGIDTGLEDVHGIGRRL